MHVLLLLYLWRILYFICCFSLHMFKISSRYLLFKSLTIKYLVCYSPQFLQLEVSDLLGYTNLCLSLNWGKFLLLFPPEISSAPFFLLSPFGIPITCILNLLIISHRFVRLCSNFMYKKIKKGPWVHTNRVTEAHCSHPREESGGITQEKRPEWRPLSLGATLPAMVAQELRAGIPHSAGPQRGCFSGKTEDWNQLLLPEWKAIAEAGMEGEQRGISTFFSSAFRFCCMPIIGRTWWSRIEGQKRGLQSSAPTSQSRVQEGSVVGRMLRWAPRVSLPGVHALYVTPACDCGQNLRMWWVGQWVPGLGYSIWQIVMGLSLLWLHYYLRFSHSWLERTGSQRACSRWPGRK